MFPNTNFTHQPVLAARCIELLGQGIEQAGQQGRALVIDGTLGLGGHSELILQTYPQVHLIGIDRDKQALASASRRLREYSSRFTAVHATYDAIGQVAAAYEDDAYPLGGILMDLGVSSLQLDDVARGFSYARDADLDMRMDQDAPLTAREVVNTYSYSELVKIFFRYGEEKFSKQIAREIERVREKQPIETTGELVEIIKTAIPAPARRKGGHPAKRIFQAIRIAVNDELGA
ncbi:MAG: 16S rRNA (cytosine(1402)-N(4))-methyltransferase RsmH, partial [Varibaculum cambriense]|nr:16S rRNA (cytosine(1402)-N(4))-methyltransferase RsmH [Varibaculum cambriense]